MNVANYDLDLVVSKIAAAMGEPARVRILHCLLYGRARTSTKLATVAEVTPSTTSVHLNRLKRERLVEVVAQGKHRYYTLRDADVARALEALSLVATGSRERFISGTPTRLVIARTCYDHMAGKLGVLLHTRFKTMGWLYVRSARRRNACELSKEGAKAFEALGIDLEETRKMRRRFAYECLDWSERQPHLAGALGAALLGIARKRKWVAQDLDSRL
jgi:DNA-binding transcriptional ArsR family regulator